MATNNTKTTKSKKKKHGIKTEFVRSKPDMTAAEIIAAGLKLKKKIRLTPNHVYNIRSIDRKAALAAGGESTETTDGESTASKAQPVAQAPAKANGKSPAAKNGKSAATRSARGSSRPTSSVTRQARPANTSDAESEMRTLVLRIGLDRAMEIFSEIETAAMSMVRGRKAPTDSSSSARQAN